MDTDPKLPGRAPRVLLADDEPLFRASLRHLLAIPPEVVKEVYGVDIGDGFQVVGEAAGSANVLRLVDSAQADLLLLDLNMSRLSGIEVLRELAECGARAKTLLLAAAIDRASLIAAVGFGVGGIVLKHASAERLFGAIQTVAAGGHWLDQTLVTDLMESTRPLIKSSRAAGQHPGLRLTPREREVLSRVVAGCANKDIAREFAVSEETIKHHLTRMLDKFGAANRVELAMLAAERGVDCRV